MPEQNGTLRWPLPVNLSSLLDQRLKPLMRGYVLELTERLGAPVIFAYPKQPGNIDVNNIEIINDRKNYSGVAAKSCAKILELETALHKDDAAGTIVGLCASSDKQAMLHYMAWLQQPEPKGNNPEGWIPELYKDKSYYIYTCALLGYDEWFIPICIDGEFAGAFITGQFASENSNTNPNTRITELLSKARKKNKPEITTLCKELAELLEKKDGALEKRTAKQKESFITEVLNAQRELERFYEDKNAGEQIKITKRLTEIASGKIEGYNQGKDEAHNFSDRFYHLRTNFCDAMIEYKEVFNLAQLHLFKPRRNPNNEVRGLVQGAILSEKDKATKKDHDELTRDFDSTKYTLKRNEIKEVIIKQMTAGEIAAKRIKTTTFQGIIEIKPLLESFYQKDTSLAHIPEDEELENSLLIVCGINDFHENYVGCLIRAKEGRAFTEQHKETFMSVFKAIGFIFIARWNIAESARSERNAIENYDLFSHELSQYVAGVSTNIDEVVSRFAAARNFTPTDLRNSHPRLPQVTEEFHDVLQKRYMPNIKNFVRNVGSIIDQFKATDNIGAKDETLKKEIFRPYSRLLYSCVNSLKKEEEEKNLRIIIPTIMPFEDPNNPRIAGDLNRLISVVTNLLTNAIKYSHRDTNIHVMAAPAERKGKKVYNIVVTNYGLPIPESEHISIFEHRIRGGNAVLDEGKGIGLSLCTKIAKMHSGDVELSEHIIISDYNVPLLEPYANSSHAMLKDEIRVKCFEEIEKLKKEGIYNDIVNKKNHRYISNDFTYMHFNRLIKRKTAKISFKLWFPI